MKRCFKPAIASMVVLAFLSMASTQSSDLIINDCYGTPEQCADAIPISTDGGGMENTLGDAAGDLFGDGVGDFIGEYGDDIFGGFKTLLGDGGFSVKNILDIGCSTSTNAANDADGGNNGSDVSRAICDAKEAYEIIDQVSQDWSAYLTVWGSDVATGFIASELGLGKGMNKEDLEKFSSVISDAIQGVVRDPNDPTQTEILDTEARLANLSQGKLTQTILEATGIALDKQVARRKDFAEGSAERRYYDVITTNPNLASIDNQNQLEILENVGAEAQGIENSLRSGQIGLLSGEKTDVLNEVGENLEAYSEVRFKQFDSAVSTRAVQQYNSQAIVDAITNQNVSFQQISAQLSLAAQQEAVATQQFSIMTKLQADEMSQKARGRSAALQAAINKNIDGVESISLGVESVGVSFTQLPASSGTVGASAFK